MGIERSEITVTAGLIKDCERVLVLAHEHPDGDAFGSMLGMGLMLEEAGKIVYCSWPDPIEMPGRYAFLPGRNLFTKPADIPEVDLVISVDCSNILRLKGLKRMLNGGAKVINFDHHRDNSFFGYVNIVDPEAAAVSEILYLSADELGLKINIESALCFYTGIVTDTGRFQFSNTSGTTLKIASEMVEMGVDPNVVYENVYQSDSLPYLRLCGNVLSNAVIDEDLGLIHGSVTQEDMRHWGVTMDEMEDLVDYLRSLKGHRIAALFKELEDGSIRVSLRSRTDIDVGTIARRLGGGGHRAAAAYTSGRRNLDEALVDLRGEIVEVGRHTGSR